MCAIGCGGPVIVPDRPLVTDPGSAPHLGLEITLIVSPDLRKHTLDTARGGRLKTGAGVTLTLRTQLARLGIHSRVLPSVSAAVQRPDGAPGSLLLLPSLANVAVSDQITSASASIELRLLVLAPDGTPLERLQTSGRVTGVEVETKRVYGSKQERAQRHYEHMTRVTTALTAALSEASQALWEALARSEAVRLAVGTPKRLPMLAERFAVSYWAHAECARGKEEPLEAVNARFGLVDPAAVARAEQVIDGLPPTLRLESLVRRCETPGVPFEVLLGRSLRAAGDAIAQGKLERADTLLGPLVAEHDKYPRVRAAAARLALAEAEADAKEAAKERIEGELARTKAQEALAGAEQSAAERIRKQEEADALARTARKLLARKKVKKAQKIALEALALVGNHVEARDIIRAVAAGDSLKAREAARKALAKARKQALAQLKRQRGKVRGWNGVCRRMRAKYAAANKKSRRAYRRRAWRTVRSLAAKQRTYSGKYAEAKYRIAAVARAYRNAGMHAESRAVLRSGKDCR